MIPNEPQPHKQASKKSEEAIPGTPPEKWTPTAASFDKFLAVFSSDRNEAAQRYEIARRKLILYFERRHIIAAGRCADETLDRAMRRIDQGKNVTNVMPYLFEIAYYVVLEEWKAQEKLRIAMSAMSNELRPPPVDTDGEKNARQDCLDRCLEELTPENRALLLRYYEETGHAKIKLHTEMANSLGITLNNLRIRIHRLRAGVEVCVKNCMSDVALSE